ncbi:MAG: Hsp20/alpha crystallin family protein [Nitrospirae bacterium]|nr:Hsp20/alpha crystallin family protein [Nitrospirota bacterium]
MNQPADKFIILEQKCEGSCADIYETDSDFLIDIDLPGYDVDEIGVRIYEQWVIIECSKQNDYNRAFKFICLERCCSPIKRALRLPSTVRSEGSEAVYSKGVLSLKLQKNSVVFTNIKVVKK